MKTYNYLDLTPQQIEVLCLRQLEDDQVVRERVREITERVRNEGDKALLDYARQFDQVLLNRLYLDAEELAAIAAGIPDEARLAIDTAYENIRNFHAAQIHLDAEVETMPGVNCWRENRPIDKVGLYIPGGSAVLPSTFLMLGVPAQLAGCKEIVVCSPPQKDGKTNCYVAYVAQKLGVTRVYLIGGAQAVAAMACGTESVPKVYKIFGPGNRYVTQAKQLVQSAAGTAIDMPAGPSEVLVLADETCVPAFAAADLLAQAEHGADSQAILVATSDALVEQVMQELEVQLQVLPRRDVAAKAIENSYAVVAPDLEKGMAFSNAYAPEHLILATKNFEDLVPLVQNAGSVFLGNLTPESAGDYASGTNHTLPTSGFARAYSGVSLDSFVKKITFQRIDPEGLQQIGRTVEVLAEAEGLEAHKNAMSIRMKNV